MVEDVSQGQSIRSFDARLLMYDVWRIMGSDVASERRCNSGYERDLREDEKQNKGGGFTGGHRLCAYQRTKDGNEGVLIDMLMSELSPGEVHGRDGA
jgi:hypothetical protein